MTFGPNVTRPVEKLERIAVDLVGQLNNDGGTADVSLVITSTRFDSGTALVEAATSRRQADAEAPGSPGAAAQSGICPKCGEAFRLQNRGAPKIYCSSTCSDRARARRRRLNGGTASATAAAAPEPYSSVRSAEPPPSAPTVAQLGRRPGSPFGHLDRPAAVEPDAKVTSALLDIGKLSPETAIFGPRGDPPSVPWEP